MAQRPTSRAAKKVKGAANSKPRGRQAEDGKDAASNAASKASAVKASAVKASAVKASAPKRPGAKSPAAKSPAAKSPAAKAQGAPKVSKAPNAVGTRSSARQAKRDASDAGSVAGKIKSGTSTSKNASGTTKSAAKASRSPAPTPEVKAVRPTKTAAATKTKRPEPPPEIAAEAPRTAVRKTRTAAKSPARSKPKPAPPPYLAVELGQPADRDGEPIGAASPKAQSDESLQAYALKLWRQMQTGNIVNRYTRAIERAGLTTDEVWTAGLGEMRPTSSTADEIRRYRQKVLFRANLLEAILTETVADLHRLEHIEPAAPREGEPSDAAEDRPIDAKRQGAAHGRPRGS